MFGVLGVGNILVGKNGEGYRGAFFDDSHKLDAEGQPILDADGNPVPTYVNHWSDDAPNSAYRLIGMFVGNFVDTMRLGMGDFANIEASKYLT